MRRLLSPGLRKPDALAGDDLEAGLEVVYRFLLARPMDESGRRHYMRRIREDGMRLREVADEIARSDEFQERVKSRVMRPRNEQPAASERPEGFIDVTELMKTLDAAALARTAEDYYRKSIAFAASYHAKPLTDPHDAPDLLGSFAHLLGGLRLSQGMNVLDFGAGTCWTTRCLTQLGCAVTAVDVSATALAIGRELFRVLPLVGARPEPTFLVFDGRHIDLPDESVDRIVCVDAFHHVPNPAEVLAELGRVLRPGGIAGFSEPGPNHSKAAHSQFEMKNFTVVENDVVMADIWPWAKAAGFTGLELAVFSTESCRVSLTEFDDLMAGGPSLDAYGDRLRSFLSNHRTFFLSKGERPAMDSRGWDGLQGEIAITLERTALREGEPLRGQATVRNLGEAVWLPGQTPVGGVNLGAHLRTHEGHPLDVNFGRVCLVGSTGPGETQTIDFALAPPPPGEYLLEFDLVSEGVCWFERNGSATTTVAIAVGGANAG